MTICVRLDLRRLEIQAGDFTFHLIALCDDFEGAFRFVDDNARAANQALILGIFNYRVHLS